MEPTFRVMSYAPGGSIASYEQWGVNEAASFMSMSPDVVKNASVITLTLTDGHTYVITRED